MEQKILIFKFLITFYLTLYSSASFSEKIIEGKAKIIDGDTIHIGKNKIRLHGIDAPEINQTCEKNNITWLCGENATNALVNIINSQKIICSIKDIDQYNRYIGVCFVNNLNMNKYMVINGWAIAYRYYSKDYIEVENIAKRKKVGIWQGSFQEPYLFRKKQKN